MSTQEKITFATQQPNKAFLHFISNTELNDKHGLFVSNLMKGKLYTTNDMMIATATSLVYMILNKEI